MLAARSQVRGQPICLFSIDCCAKRTVWSCRQLQKLENKATQKQTGNHTHEETSDQSFEDASKASSHFGENDQNNISRNKIHNPNNDNNISIIYKKNTHNGNNDKHKHRPNDNQNNLIMYNHARRADEMRRWYAQTGWGEDEGTRYQPSSAASSQQARVGPRDAMWRQPALDRVCRSARMRA